MTGFYLQESTHKRDIDLATKSRTVLKETEVMVLDPGVRQRALGAHTSVVWVSTIQETRKKNKNQC
jgi:hypothetical protein